MNVLQEALIEEWISKMREKQVRNNLHLWAVVLDTAKREGNYELEEKARQNIRRLQKELNSLN